MVINKNFKNTLEICIKLIHKILYLILFYLWMKPQTSIYL
jgi:hypothetical protein